MVPVPLRVQNMSLVDDLDLEWSEPRRVHTKYGERFLSTAEPDGHFWKEWRANQDELKRLGISVSKREIDGKNVWQVCHWQNAEEPVSAEEAHKTAQMLRDRARNGQAQYQREQVTENEPGASYNNVTEREDGSFF